MLGRTAQQAKKKRKKKQMPTMAARQSADDPPPLRPPDTNHYNPRLRTTAYKTAPPRRKATPTTLLPGHVLGFPRHAEGGGGWISPTPSRKEWWHPQVSPHRSRRTGKDFSRTPSPPPNGPEPTSQTAAHHHAPSRLRRHPRRLTANTNTRPRGPERSAPRREKQHRSRTGGNHLHRRRAGGQNLRHRRGSRPDAAAGHARPPLARPGPKRAR